ncbi:7220_t:CDS:2, partial [Ambispora gerdemannii]
FFLMPVKDEGDPDYRQREEKDGMTPAERKTVNEFLKKHGLDKKEANKKQKTGAIIRLSPRLKSFLRKKFDFPPALNDYLDYSKTDSEGDSNYYYRLDGEHGLEQEKPKKCKSCGELTLEEEGPTVGKEFGQDSKVIGYFHPNCAKKYFVDKEQTSENNIRIKEKLLRNLDKISLNPIGYLANAEIVKGDIEKDYYKGDANSESINAKIHKVEIEGEEMDLVKLE